MFALFFYLFFNFDRIIEIIFFIDIVFTDINETFRIRIRCKTNIFLLTMSISKFKKIFYDTSMYNFPSLFSIFLFFWKQWFLT